jgi:hypothetical protein
VPLLATERVFSTRVGDRPKSEPISDLSAQQSAAVRAGTSPSRQFPPRRSGLIARVARRPREPGALRCSLAPSSRSSRRRETSQDIRGALPS